MASDGAAMDAENGDIYDLYILPSHESLLDPGTEYWIEYVTGLHHAKFPLCCHSTLSTFKIISVRATRLTFLLGCRFLG